MPAALCELLLAHPGLEAQLADRLAEGGVLRRAGFARRWGGIAAPGTAEYEDACSLFSPMVERRPAMVARCTATEDAVAALAFVRGAGFGPQFKRLPEPNLAIEAINANPDGPVAISMRRKSAEELRAEQARIYDAESHPLGSPRLRLADD